MNKLRQLLGDIRSSFWFVPSLVVADSIAIAMALIQADTVWGGYLLDQWPRLFGTGAEGARQMLSTLAGSMITVMGITFSMTLVALTLASSQYTSRILRNFMRSSVTQGTLGFFAGIFTYCIIVLGSIRGGEAEFVPSLAVLFAFNIALGGVVVLIFFIHHIASSIQASSIIESITQETISAIDQIFPKDTEKGLDEDQALQDIEGGCWHSVQAGQNGYIQRVDSETLLRLSRDTKTILRMESGIGDFVVHSTVLVSIDMADPPDQEMVATLKASYSISRHRTVSWDPAFGIRQIVDIALKALSPGVNDNSTAVICIDYLTAILARVAPRKFPRSCLYEEGELRMLAIVPTFESLLSESFDQVRDSAAGNVGIMARMLSALDILGALTASPGRRRAIHDQVQWLAELAGRSIESKHDRDRLARRVRDVRETLKSEVLPS